MNWPKVALVALFVLPGIAFVAPWATGVEMHDWPNLLVWLLVGGILAAMFILGREQRREELAAETLVDDPRRSKFENWMAKRRERFSPKRGVEFFFFGLIAFSIMVGMGALSGEVASLTRAIIFVVAASAVAGLFGMFTEKVPL